MGKNLQRIVCEFEGNLKVDTSHHKSLSQKSMQVSTCITFNCFLFDKGLKS